MAPHSSISPAIRSCDRAIALSLLTIVDIAMLGRATWARGRAEAYFCSRQSRPLDRTEMGSPYSAALHGGPGQMCCSQASRLGIDWNC